MKVYIPPCGLTSIGMHNFTFDAPGRSRSRTLGLPAGYDPALPVMRHRVDGMRFQIQRDVFERLVESIDVRPSGEACEIVAAERTLPCSAGEPSGFAGRSQAVVRATVGEVDGVEPAAR